MKLAEIFETRIEEKFDPVIKVSDVEDEAKLASEIDSYVVTPTIEKFVDDFLEHFTDTARQRTTEIGAWISGYFGSGKSHLAKVLALLVENRELAGHTAARRFEARVPVTALRRSSLLRSLSALDRSSTQILAFNLNTLSESRTTPLPRMLLSQYYQSRGYSSNVIFARVIEQEVDRRGKLDELHSEVARLAGRPWEEIRRNPTFYHRHLYEAVCTVAPEEFESAAAVEQAIKTAQGGDLFNVQVLVETLLADLKKREQESTKPQRMLFVLDESGQWIEDDSSRLAQLQALVEEAAVKGQGKIWIFVTTHEDMGSVYQGARVLQADMKKIEGRFRFKWSLTTENIELVLEDRVFKKKQAGVDAVARVYDSSPGVLRGLGELSRVEGRSLPTCERERFIAFYPFFPYQIHLIPEIVKSLRSKGGRGEQMSGSTRTLLAITQDVLRAGRRPYLRLAVGEIVSFDEVYNNLAGEAEVSPDARRELSIIEQVVPGATLDTRRVAEVLYLVRELAFVPRTLDNLARLLVESASDEIAKLVARYQPELDRLMAAKMVARVGDEFDFLTGVRRSFEDEVAAHAAELKLQDRELGFAKYFVSDPDGGKGAAPVWLRPLSMVEYLDVEFSVKLNVDGTLATRGEDVDLWIYSPLSALGGLKVSDLEQRSQQPGEENRIFVQCDRIPGFDQDLGRFLAMKEVVNAWKGDSQRSAEARDLVQEREANDLDKQRRKVEAGITEGLRNAHVIFRGMSRAHSLRSGLTPAQSLRAEVASYLPNIYPKLDKAPTRIANEREAIREVLSGGKSVSPDVRALRLFDKAGALNPQSPIVDGIRLYLSTRQSRNERVLGKELVREFAAPPYGWDPNAVRVAVAACVRAGVIKLLINKMPHSNPADPTVLKALRDSREFDRVELVLEDAELDSETLEAVRTILIELTGKRRMDETPASLHQAMQEFGGEKLGAAKRVKDWAEAASFPLPPAFHEAMEVFSAVLDIENPSHRVKEILGHADKIRHGAASIDEVVRFHEKWRAAFVEARDLATQLGAIEHLLPAGGAARRYLDEHRLAVATARFAVYDVWKGLQDSKAAAALEVEGLLQTSRAQARDLVQSARDQLMAHAEAASVAPDVADKVGEALGAFLESAENEREPARVAVQPERARRLIADLRDLIRREAGLTQAQPQGSAEQQVRQTKQVPLSEVAQVRRVRDEATWQEVLEKLDSHVRELLAKYDVELD